MVLHRLTINKILSLTKDKNIHCCASRCFGENGSVQYCEEEYGVIEKQIFQKISSLLDQEEAQVDANMPLLGDGSLLDSMKLVELCISLEDLAEDMGFEFDWTSEAAMSKSRSMFRTAGALAAEFSAQMDVKK